MLYQAASERSFSTKDRHNLHNNRPIRIAYNQKKKKSARQSNKQSVTCAWLQSSVMNICFLVLKRMPAQHEQQQRLKTHTLLIQRTRLT